MRIAYLTSADMVPGRPGARGDLWELEAHLAELVPAAERRGHELVLAVWDEPSTLSEAWDAVVVGTPWDYAPRAEQFLGVVDALANRAPVLNPPSLLRWNASKTYLRELAQRGIPTVPTQWAEDIDADAVRRAHDAFGGPGVVVKRVVGAGAKGQILWNGSGAVPRPPSGAVMLQPFLPSATTEGELSLVFFDRTFSHAAQKRPQDGDYRVQSLYGGTETVYEPDEEAIAVAQACLDAVDGPLLYARVDLMRHEGTLRVMELEVIEPYLYALQGPGMGERFMAAFERLVPSHG